MNTDIYKRQNNAMVLALIKQHIIFFSKQVLKQESLWQQFNTIIQFQ